MWPAVFSLELPDSNDRGPFVKGRVIDVSLSAARALGMIEAGVVLVSVHDE